MVRSLLFLSLVLFAGCASTTEVGIKPVASASDAKDDKQADELEELQTKLDLARVRLEIAELEREAFVEKHAVQMRHASTEVGMAEAKLATFREVEAPNRIASEELSLRAAKDRAQEAAEELAQIQIMYEEQDLDDLTAEFVVNRGRRSAERAAARIKIQEGEFQAIEQRELPQEEARLELELDRKVTGQNEAEREREIGMRKKEMGIREARNEIEKLEREIAELGEKK